jgi:hypothetical protein
MRKLRAPTRALYLRTRRFNLDGIEVVEIVVMEDNNPAGVGSVLESRPGLCLHLAAILQDRIQNHRRRTPQALRHAGIRVPWGGFARGASTSAVAATEALGAPGLRVAAVANTAAHHARHEETVAEGGAGTVLKAGSTETTGLIRCTVEAPEADVLWLENLCGADYCVLNCVGSITSR